MRPPVPGTALRGRMGSTTRRPSDCVHMRLHNPAQRFAATYGAPPNVAAAASTWAPLSQQSASWQQ
eukprot:1280185-Pyramimonas_sp.AAC.1